MKSWLSRYHEIKRSIERITQAHNIELPWLTESDYLGRIKGYDLVEVARNKS